MIFWTVIATGAVAGGLIGLDRLANSVVRPVPTPPERSVADTGLEHQTLTIESSGHRLGGWLVHSRGRVDEGPLVVMAHGWGANSGTVLRQAEPLAHAGYDVLLFDLRGHGGNEAVPYVTVRHLRDDVAAALRHARDRFPGRPIVLFGHSFGGAASVLAVAEGAEVAGLILVATPSDVLRITAEYLSDHGLPGAVLTVLLRPFWWWRLGGTFRPHRPVDRIAEVHSPLLIIHPEHDQRVHRGHAERMSAAAGVPYHLVVGREHTDVLGAPETTGLVTDFLSAIGSRRGTRESTPS